MSQKNSDIEPMHLAILASRAALSAGNSPYGAVLVSKNGKVLHVSENKQNTNNGTMGHAEMLLVQEATSLFGAAALIGSTVYASGEPCAMCAGTLFWAGIERIVFAASNEVMTELLGGDTLPIKCADVLAGASRHVHVDGPVLAADAAAVLREARSRRSDTTR